MDVKYGVEKAIEGRRLAKFHRSSAGEGALDIKTENFTTFFKIQMPHRRILLERFL